MVTAIERFLYGSGGTHAVVEFALAENRLFLRIAPWENLANISAVEFTDMKLTSVEVYSVNVHELNLPWDIIGFDESPLSDGRWSFGLHCGGIEYGFESRWPTILNG